MNSSHVNESNKYQNIFQQAVVSKEEKEDVFFQPGNYSETEQW